MPSAVRCPSPALPNPTGSAPFFAEAGRIGRSCTERSGSKPAQGGGDPLSTFRAHPAVFASAAMGRTSVRCEHGRGARQTDRKGEGMLVWSVVTVLAFLALNAVVIALGASSTARYEQERNESSRPVAADARTPEQSAAA